MADSKKVHGIHNGELKFHTKQAGADEEKYSRESNLEAAARALIINFSGHKGSGDKVYIDNNGKKMTVDDVSVWMNNLDKNKDGTITQKELQAGGGDRLGILKMNATPEEQEKVSKAIYKEQIIGGMKGMRKGLNTPWVGWKVAKPIIKKNTSKADMTYMLKIPEVKEYFDAEIWGKTTKKAEENENCREHFRELVQDYKYTKEELKALKFTDEQIKYFLSK